MQINIDKKSGILGGIFYAAWISLALVVIGRRVWNCGDPMAFAIFAGLVGWYVQGLGEFSLYVPALAWTAFTLLGLPDEVGRRLLILAWAAAGLGIVRAACWSALTKPM